MTPEQLAVLVAGLLVGGLIALLLQLIRDIARLKADIAHLRLAVVEQHQRLLDANARRSVAESESRLLARDADDRQRRAGG